MKIFLFLLLFILKPVSAQNYSSEDYMFLLPFLVFVVLVSVLIPLLQRVFEGRISLIVAFFIGVIAVFGNPFEEWFLVILYPFGWALLIGIFVMFLKAGFKSKKRR